MVRHNPFLPYLRYGWSVLPLLPGDKLPDADLLPRAWDEELEREKATWKPYQKRAPRPVEVRQWLATRADINVGIVTGAVSGLIVLDLDNAAAIRDATRRGLPRTAMATTGKGLHVYLAHPGGRVPNRANLIPEVPGYDLRGDGGYVVAPPSLHSSGKRYRWRWAPTNGRVASPPGWLLDLLAPPKPNWVASASISVQAPLSDRHRQAYLDRAVELEPQHLREAAEGCRNTTLNRAAFCLGQLVGPNGLDEVEIEAQLLAAAITSGLPSGEASRTIASGLRAGKDASRLVPNAESGPLA